ncbi:hypothetical protein C1J03_23665 (plasmid) [Sulfitobacter sp. SK012]|uniref:WD40 repeat domain-containing protein n=1 Tax=Sulfitobacter sp. SK012 TaxID=1389005 RepID=UPI000E0B2968|nr:WD40 repeat domain-containing protein [Sulfitobacter sp. SK012]AXI49116.1 hypothetical protein C1J03_23665 [Sulfitobacter sp. SK012]
MYRTVRRLTSVLICAIAILVCLPAWSQSTIQNYFGTAPSVPIWSIFDDGANPNSIGFDLSGNRVLRGAMRGVSVFGAADGAHIASLGAGAFSRSFSNAVLSDDGESVHLVVVVDGQNQFFETRRLNGIGGPDLSSDMLPLFPNNHISFNAVDRSHRVHLFGAKYQTAHVVYSETKQVLEIASDFGTASGAPLSSGEFALVVRDGLAIYDQTGSEINRIAGGEVFMPGQVAVSDDERLMAVEGYRDDEFNEVIRVYDLYAGQVAYDLYLPEPDKRQYIAGLRFSDAGLVVALVDYTDREDQVLRVFRLFPSRDAELLSSVDLGKDGTLAALNGDATRLAVTWFSGRTELFALDKQPQTEPQNPTPPTTTLIPRLVAGLGHPDQISDVVISSDGRLMATAGDNGVVWLWDMQTNRAINGLLVADYGSTLLFSEDSRYLYVVDSQSFYQFETVSGDLVHRSDFLSGRPIFFQADANAEGFFSCTNRRCSGFSAQSGTWPELIDTPWRHFSQALMCDGQFVLRKTEGNRSQIAFLSLGAERQARMISVDLPVSYAACAKDGALYLGTEDGWLHKIASDGNVLSKIELGEYAIRGITQLHDGAVLVAMNGIGYVGRKDVPAQLFVLSPHTLSVQRQAEFSGGQNGTGAHVEHLVLSRDGKFAVTTTQAAMASPGIMTRWSVPDLVPRAGPATTMRVPQSVQFSSNGKSLAVTFRDATALWSLETGRVTKHVSHGFMSRVFLTEDGISSKGPNNGPLPEQYRRSFEEGPLPVRVPGYGLDADKSMLLRIGEDDTAVLMSEDGSKQATLSLSGIDPLAAVASSDLSSIVATGIVSKTLLWNAATGKSQLLDARIVGRMGVAFSPDGTLVALAERTGFVSLWKIQTGELLVRLVSMRDGGWAVASPEGRYDATDPGNVVGLSWVLPDAPLSPEPVETYYLDYYEPRLLSRKVLAEAFPAVPLPSERNRVTPDIRIAKIRPLGADADGIARVAVDIELTQRYRNGVASGIGSVKLFRDGQLVGSSSTNSFDGTDIITVQFNGIRLPPDQSVFVFSTYAFNNDRIKSETEARLFESLGQETETQRQAYVIAVGVNAYANPSWNLSYAASDAEANTQLISQGLEASGDFEKIHRIALISRDDGQPQLARRDVIEAVLRRIAGLPLPDDLPQDVLEIAMTFPPARPQDLVYLALAGHGLATQDGQFHFFTQEFGAGTTGRMIDDTTLNNTLNSDRLADLLMQIDVRDMLLVIDACNSAASVEGGGFKPGPMGSRGLGQLAYDKSMRVLAASQSEELALESDQLLHGALSYAMLREGLEAEHADRAPKDGATSFSELFEFTTQRVPLLYSELQTGGFVPLARGSFSLVESDDADLLQVQRPALFDFRRISSAEVVMKTLPN